MPNNENKLILVAASPTGGHLIPAITLANEIRKNHDYKFHFVSAGWKVEEDIFKNTNFERTKVRSLGIKNKGIKDILRFFINLPLSFLDSNRLLNEKKPCLVIGVGGFLSVFPVITAFLKKIPIHLHEAEKKPGLANKFLSLFADSISTSYPETKFLKNSKSFYSGHIIKERILTVPKISEDRITPKKILILGGSQGSNAIDQAIIVSVSFFKNKDVELIHQCRSENISKLEKLYGENKIKFELKTFIQNPEIAYAWSDFIISRSGAGTIKELAVVGRPAILIPLPGTEQEENAKILESTGQALLVSESNIFKLKSNLAKAFEEVIYLKMKKAKSLIRKDSVTLIAEKCLFLIS